MRKIQTDTKPSVFVSIIKKQKKIQQTHQSTPAGRKNRELSS